MITAGNWWKPSRKSIPVSNINEQMAQAGVVQAETTNSVQSQSQEPTHFETTPVQTHSVEPSNAQTVTEESQPIKAE